MDKLALMTVGVFMLAGIHIAVTTQDNLFASEEQMAEDQHEILARQAAIAGLDRAKQLLSENFQAYSNFTGSNDGVTYVLNATTTGNVAVVQVMGADTLSNGEVADYYVRAEFRRRIVLPPEAPPFMRYAVISDDDLELRGNIEGDIYVDGDADNELNADMHTNGTLKVTGNAASVHGFGTYVLTADPSVESLKDNFVPNYNPSEADHVYRTSSVEIPEMIPSDVAAALAVDSVSVGDISVSGDLDMGGTRENPYVWYVQGDMTLQNGNTTVDGYIMFIVEGGVDIRGNVRVGDSGYGGADESSIAVYTGSGVRMRGNSEIWGQIYSAGGVEFESGTPTVYGSVTTKGAVDFRGTVDIFYRKASPALTTPFQPNLFMLDRIAYSEW